MDDGRRVSRTTVSLGEVARLAASSMVYGVIALRATSWDYPLIPDCLQMLQRRRTQPSGILLLGMG